MQTIVIADSKYKGLLSDILKEDVEYRSIRGSYSFQTFLKKDMQLYRHYSQIVLQRSLIEEDDTQFVQLLEQLLMIYDKLKVVIIYPNADNSFIKSLLKLDVFNIASAAEETKLSEELEKCLTPDGMDALEWIRQYPELVSTEPEDAKPQKKLILTKTRIASAAVCLLLTSTLIIAAAKPKHDNASPAEASDVETSDVRTMSVIERKSVTTTTTAATATTTARPVTTTAAPTTTAPRTTTTRKTTTSKATTTERLTSKAAVTTSSSTTPATQPTYTQTPAPITTSKPATTTTTRESKTTTAAPKTTTKATSTSKKTTTKKQTTAAAVKVNAIRLATDYAANNIILSTGQTSHARAVIAPDNATNKAVTWESNRPDIAIVDGSGRIIAISKGKAIITATTVDGGLSASCMVTVDD